MFCQATVQRSRNSVGPRTASICPIQSQQFSILNRLGHTEMSNGEKTLTDYSHC